MVMAGNEGIPGTAAEDSLSTRLQWLRQRREALQEKLAQKNSELKNLCVEEAELTGILPAEIPLEPGESPPLFRRRVGTAFTYPQNLINRLKTNEAEESALELERQVQIGIVEAALGIVNDPTESKAVRRKHRLVYQQSQRRLQELDARLNFIRQSRGKTHRPSQFPQAANYSAQTHPHTNIKHRTKKPRPPVDAAGNDGNAKPARSLIQEGGISLSPIGPEQKCNTYPGHGYEEQALVPNIYNHNHSGVYPTTSPIDRQNIKIIEHDHNDNHNVYILPDQYRVRTFSHGSNGSRGQNHYADVERVYRPVPNTYTDDEHHVRYRQFQQQSQHHKLSVQDPTPNHHYADFKHMDNDISQRSSQLSYDRELRTSQYVHGPDYQAYCKSTQPQLLQRRDRELGRNARHGGTSAESHLPPGYWVRYDDEIVWCTDEQPISDRFGSLDRRKRNALQYTSSINADNQSRYRTVAIGGAKTSPAGSHQHQPVQLLPLTEQVPTSNKMLLRTQSLGSVETWHSGQSQESQNNKDTTDSASRKAREKEWYETSLDSGASSGLDLAMMNTHPTIHFQSSPPPPRAKPPNNNEVGKEKYTGSVNRPKKETPPFENQRLQPNQMCYEHHRPKVLEIPAESKPQENDDAIRLGSPQNCTIVQAGKYQPYREVTKPFEMSDFYKYSTKFRKKSETVAQGVSNSSPQDPKSDFSGCDTYGESDSSNYLANNTVASPVQKRIYQPVQRMTCQPYITNLR